MKYSIRILFPALLLVIVLSATGCKKQAPASAPAATAPAAPVVMPTAKLTADRTEILAGDSILLAWNTTEATTVMIEGIGNVPASGTKNVSPFESTNYHLIVRNANGMADATVRITVNHPQAIEKPTKKATEEEEFWMNMEDVFFDYDSYSVDEKAKVALAKDAAFLMTRPNEKIVIGGYCDERGSNEYNISLGQNRANSAKAALVAAGVSEKRIRVVSFGKERPFCTQTTEECWEKNRRDGFTLDK